MRKKNTPLYVENMVTRHTLGGKTPFRSVGACIVKIAWKSVNPGWENTVL